MSLFLTIMALLVLHASAFKAISPSFIRSSRSPSLLMAFDWKVTKKSSEEKMVKSVESLQSQLNTLRTSGANPNVLDRIIVDCFDSTAPLNQVARVSAADSQQLLVEPFDKALIKEIEKAIMCSNLNLNPNSDGDVIRINLPPLTEDRRKDMVKQAGNICESSKVSIRNIRRDCVDKIKQAEKVKDIGKDESKGYQDDLQKSTDNFIKKMESILKVKEGDLLKI
eukprot:gene11798-13693_t